MRQRITYLLPEGIGIDPSDIEVGEFDLTFAKTHSTAEERRITLGLSELPQEVGEAILHLCYAFIDSFSRSGRFWRASTSSTCALCPTKTTRHSLRPSHDFRLVFMRSSPQEHPRQSRRGSFEKYFTEAYLTQNSSMSDAKVHLG